jgi:hypothetical protein
MARSARLPVRFPAGTRYVVEGRTGAKGLFQVSARYVVLPNGRRFDLPARTAIRRDRGARRLHRFARARSEQPLRLGV